MRATTVDAVNVVVIFSGKATGIVFLVVAFFLVTVCSEVRRWIDKRRSHRHHFLLHLWWHFCFAICLPLDPHPFPCIPAIISHAALLLSAL